MTALFMFLVRLKTVLPCDLESGRYLIKKGGNTPKVPSSPIKVYLGIFIK